MSNSLLIRKQFRLILAITLVYILSWLTYFGQTPEGAYLSEQARVTLSTAAELAVSQPAENVKYSLYTYTLSIFAPFLDNDSSLALMARGLNALALLVSTFLCASTSYRYWSRIQSAWISGLLVGLNPVILFWSTEVSPTMFATLCVSAAILIIQRWLRSPKLKHSFWIAFTFSVAALLETTLVPLALLWPIFALFINRRKRTNHLLVSLIPPALTTSLLIVSKLQLQSPLQCDLGPFWMGIHSFLSYTESPDSKSFGLYKQLHLILLLNPINWGILLILAIGGAYTRIKDGHRARGVMMALAVFIVFLLSYSFNSSGSQARTCIVPLMAILAGGTVSMPRIWRYASKPTRRKIIISTALVSVLTYTDSFLSTINSKSWEHDYVYLAKANIEEKNNERAIIWAEKALEMNPQLEIIREIIATANFNEWSIGKKQKTLTLENTNDFLRAYRDIKGNSDTLCIEAIYIYKLGKYQDAIEIWRAQVEKSALALLALYWTNDITHLSPTQVELHKDSNYYELLVDAQKVDRSALEYGNTEKLIDNIFALAY